MPLSHGTPSVEIGAETVVLVHCAQGHGRTASFVALLLGRLGIASTVEDAVALIQACRPLARMSRSQRRSVTAGMKLQEHMSVHEQGETGYDRS
jgi:protein-tyrosine phosphatase